MAFAGQLYQFRSKHQRSIGSYFFINGPWDTHGRVIKSEPLNDGEFLNLVRGVKEKER